MSELITIILLGILALGYVIYRLRKDISEGGCSGCPGKGEGCKKNCPYSNDKPEKD